MVSRIAGVLINTSTEVERQPEVVADGREPKTEVSADTPLEAMTAGGSTRSKGVTDVPPKADSDADTIDTLERQGIGKHREEGDVEALAADPSPSMWLPVRTLSGGRLGTREQIDSSHCTLPFGS